MPARNEKEGVICFIVIFSIKLSVQGGEDIVPFRESKLTHLMMPLLSRAGTNGVAMIACVNPQEDDYDETLTVLGLFLRNLL